MRINPSNRNINMIDNINIAKNISESYREKPVPAYVYFWFLLLGLMLSFLYFMS